MTNEQAVTIFELIRSKLAQGGVAAIHTTKGMKLTFQTSVECGNDEDHDDDSMTDCRICDIDMNGLSTNPEPASRLALRILMLELKELASGYHSDVDLVWLKQLAGIELAIEQLENSGLVPAAD